jgi:hypothetical protein
MLQAKECAFMTQELSAISHSRAVASNRKVTLLFMDLSTGSCFWTTTILQALSNISGHEH